MANEEDIEEHYDWEDDLDLIEEEINQNKKGEKKKNKGKTGKRENIQNIQEKSLKPESAQHVPKAKKEERSFSEDFLENEPPVKKSGGLGLWIAGFVIFLIFSGVTWYVLAPAEDNAITGKIATVNGVDITQDQLDKQYEIFFLFSGLPKSYQETLGKEEYLDQILLNEVLLLDAARTQGIEVRNEELQQNYQDFLDRNGLTEKVLIQQLEKKGLEVGDIKHFIRDRMIIARFLDKNVFGRVTATEDELQEFFDKNVQATEQVKASHILVKTREEAEEIKRLLESGRDFGELAVERSIDPSAKANRGSLGFFGRGVMVPEFEDAAFSLDVGQISDPIKSKFGFHIIKVEEKKQNITLDDVRKDVEAKVLRAKQDQELQRFLKKLRGEGTFEKKIEENSSVEITDRKKANEFIATGQTECTLGGKPIIRMFSAKEDPQSWSRDIFNALAKEYKNAVFFNWELDTGDNLITDEIEESIPKQEVDLFTHYSPKNEVPVFVFGCKYARIGNAFKEEDDAGELQEYTRILNKIL